jgi:hypothetical protein
MRSPRTITILAAAVFPFAMTALVGGGCGNKDKEEPVVTAPPPPPPPPPTQPTVIAPEVPDAGADVADAADGDGSDGKVVVGGPSGLQKCCAAIRANQKSAPPEQQVMYGIAIAACNSGQLGAIPAALRGGCQ